MSRSYNYSRNRYESNWKPLVGPVLIGLVVVLLIAWGIAEFCCTRSFVGTLVTKSADVSFTHDKQEINIDGDGDVTIDGSDETVAHKNYSLVFLSEGALRTVSAGKFRGRIGQVNREDLALAVLNQSHTEPAFYTHAKKNVEYLVTVTGWLLDGTVEDLTPLDSIKAE